MCTLQPVPDINIFVLTDHLKSFLIKCFDSDRYAMSQIV